MKDCSASNVLTYCYTFMISLVIEVTDCTRACNAPLYRQGGNPAPGRRLSSGFCQLPSKAPILEHVTGGDAN